ncbi:MAG: hypothetical protein ABJA70_00165 [Chryseolinea sp.]
MHLLVTNLANELHHIILCVLIVTATFLFWEVVAWFAYKFAMHGFLWTWHKSHHTVHEHAREKNDVLALVFSTPSIFLMSYSTLIVYSPYLLSVGIGTFLIEHFT